MSKKELAPGKNTDPLEIWGGAEYTIVRVENNAYDQLALSGHENRPDDLDLFSDLGIKTIRYPLLWEKYAENSVEFFKLHDARLNRLRELDIKPIAGLLHHGSGPFFTDLLDPDFPVLLAEYANIIATRYPWIELYTPVNEPLTTARFSGLYGIWYPHKKDDFSFLKIFLNELRGIVLSMNAIKRINHEAKLIQTEDLSKIYSTKKLKYQADFENQRRWLTYDILLGCLNSKHPLWQYFIDHGIEEQELNFFIENTTTPSVCGFNYYATSERYLDERTSLYPSGYHGRNTFQDYADVEAVRANISDQINVGSLIREAWEKYHLPLALTEVHLACTREEQLRWFHETYKTGEILRSEGIDFRAVTAWSFFGSFDWDTLMCKKNNNYETGVYDIRSGKPRATALAGLIKSITKSDISLKSLLDVPGWWRRNDRFIYKSQEERLLVNNCEKIYDQVSPLLIVGAGSLGSAFARICKTRGIVYYLSDRNHLDIASENSVRKTIGEIKPWGVINAAGFTRINDAETSSFLCFRENATGPVILADVCKSAGIKFVTFSTDQVFNGEKKKPYTETDSTHPINMYGLSKRFAEEKVLDINSNSLIVRSSFFYNPWHKDDRLLKILQSGLTSDKHYYLPSDIIISPTYIPDLVNAVLDLMIDGETGIWHLSNQEETSYYDFARMALNLAGLNETIISSVPSAKLKYDAIRPPYSVLQSSSGMSLPMLSNAINRYLNEFWKEPVYQQNNQPI